MPTVDAAVSLFLAGDVMTARGVDQILPHSVDPVLYESYMKDARGYVELAERVSGPIPESVDFSYVWGDALAELSLQRPDARIINLETSVTTSDTPAPKGIHYRMHPGNVPVLTAAGIDCCSLANNHVLDWGRAGLVETLEVLHRAGLRTAGAGLDAQQALARAAIEVGGGRRVLVLSVGVQSSGIPADWAATRERPGVCWLPEASAHTADAFLRSTEGARRDGDIVVVSVHWGGNWGHDVPDDQVAFAHRLIDAGIDIVHGHSSHHAKAIEVYRGRPIFYGCGDFVNDYEGIGGHEAYRDDLPLMYFVTLARTGELSRLVMTPMQLHKLRLRHASTEDARFLQRTLDEQCARFGARVTETRDGRLELRW